MSRLRSRDLFPTDAPVPAAGLIGRDDDVAVLRADLAAGVNQVMLGPRRTGKTSVCRGALDALAHDGVYIVGVDLFSMGSVAELAAALVAGSLANRGPAARGVRKVQTVGRALAGLASMTLTSKLQAELGQDVEIAFTPSLAGRNPEGSLDYALALMQRIADADERQLVVFFDEFQEVAHPRRPFGDPDALTKKMRASLQDSPRVTALFTGSVDHLMTDLFVPAHRAFYRFGVSRRLAAISDGDWLGGLADRFSQDRVVAADGAIETLLARSQGHARTTMLIAQQAHLVLVAAGSRRLDVQTVEEGFFAALAADTVGHQSETERIRDLGGAALTTARRLATGDRPYTGMPRRQVDAALLRLLDIGMVERTGRGDYRFTDPLLAHFLSRL
jgi:hypothetical protein